MSLDFSFPSFRGLSACGGIFSAPTSRKKRHKDKLCVKNTLFRGKGRLFTVTRPQAEFDACPKTANFAGNMPATGLIGRRSLILSVIGIM